MGRNKKMLRARSYYCCSFSYCRFLKNNILHICDTAFYFIIHILRLYQMSRVAFLISLLFYTRKQEMFLFTPGPNKMDFKRLVDITLWQIV